MTTVTTFGIGGWCKDCDASHDHPMFNIVEIYYVEDDA
jgi:hypothetical protein